MGERSRRAGNFALPKYTKASACARCSQAPRFIRVCASSLRKERIMARVKGGPVHSRKRKRVLRNASGFMGGSGTIYRAAIEFTRKAGVYAYRDRRQKKRHFRSLWISRLNAALKERGIHYNRFIPALADAGIGQCWNEPVVMDPALLERCIQPGNPQAAEMPLFLSPIAIGIN